MSPWREIWGVISGTITDPLFALLIGALGGFFIAKWLFHYLAKRAGDDKEQAVKERNAAQAAFKELQKTTASEGLSRAQQFAKLEERLEIAEATTHGLRRQLEAAALELADHHGPGARDKWDRRYEDYGVRIWLMTTKFKVQLNGELTFLGPGDLHRETVTIPPVSP